MKLLLLQENSILSFPDLLPHPENASISIKGSIIANICIVFFIVLIPGLTAVIAELTGVFSAAGAGPAVGLGLAAFRAELAGILGSAFACPLLIRS